MYRLEDNGAKPDIKNKNRTGELVLGSKHTDSSDTSIFISVTITMDECVRDLVIEVSKTTTPMSDVRSKAKLKLYDALDTVLDGLSEATTNRILELIYYKHILLI